MSIVPYLVPLDAISRTVGAENAVGGVVKVAVRIIADIFYDLLGVMAGIVALKNAGKPSPALNNPKRRCDNPPFPKRGLCL